MGIFLQFCVKTVAWDMATDNLISGLGSSRTQIRNLVIPGHPDYWNLMGKLPLSLAKICHITTDFPGTTHPVRIIHGGAEIQGILRLGRSQTREGEEERRL